MSKKKGKEDETDKLTRVAIVKEEMKCSNEIDTSATYAFLLLIYFLDTDKIMSSICIDPCFLLFSLSLVLLVTCSAIITHIIHVLPARIAIACMHACMHHYCKDNHDVCMDRSIALWVSISPNPFILFFFGKYLSKLRMKKHKLLDSIAV